MFFVCKLPLGAVRRQANQRGKVAVAPVDGAPMGVGAGGDSGGNGADDMPKKKVIQSFSCGWFLGAWVDLDSFVGPSAMYNAQLFRFFFFF